MIDPCDREIFGFDNIFALRYLAHQSFRLFFHIHHHTGIVIKPDEEDRGPQEHGPEVERSANIPSKRRPRFVANHSINRDPCSQDQSGQV